MREGRRGLRTFVIGCCVMLSIAGARNLPAQRAAPVAVRPLVHTTEPQPRHRRSCPRGVAREALNMGVMGAMTGALVSLLLNQMSGAERVDWEVPAIGGGLGVLIGSAKGYVETPACRGRPVRLAPSQPVSARSVGNAAAAARSGRPRVERIFPSQPSYVL